MLDQELDGGRVVGVQVQPARDGLDEGHALGRVAVAERLADVVEQDAQHEELGPLHLGEDLRSSSVSGPARAEALQHLDREERVLVDRIAVVVVVLDEAVERPELRQVGAEHARCRASAGASSPPGPTSGEIDRNSALRLGRGPPGLIGERGRRLLERPLQLDVEPRIRSCWACQKTRRMRAGST